MKQPTTPKEYIEASQRENADLQMSLRNWIAKCAAQAISVGDLERENAALRAALDELCDVADSAMREANRDGAGWNIKEELKEAKALLGKEAQP